jgi:hypothetical protein
MKGIIVFALMSIACIALVVYIAKGLSCSYTREYRDVYEQIQAERMITG